MARAVVDASHRPRQLVAVGRLDQRLAGREVPVQGADADAGIPGDRLERDIGAVVREGLHGDLEQSLRGCAARRRVVARVAVIVDMRTLGLSLLNGASSG